MVPNVARTRDGHAPRLIELERHSQPGETGRVRTQRHLKSITALAIFASSVLGSFGASAEVGERELWSESGHAQGEPSPTQAETTSGEWGQFSVSGSYTLATPVPGALDVVAVNTSSLYLTRYNFETNELRTSNMFFDEGLPTQLVVSPAGDWVYALVPYGSFGSVLRFDAESMRFDGRFEYSGSGTAHIAVIAGDDDAVLLSTSDSLRMYRDQSKLPGDAQGGFTTNGQLAVLSGGIGILPTTAGLQEFSTGPNGITSFELRLAGSTTHPFTTYGTDRFGWNTMVYELPDATPVPADSFLTAVDDPTEPFRYGPATVFDERTGQRLQSGYGCLDLMSGPIKPIGGGWLVGAGLEFTNVLDRCGAYGEFTPVDPARLYDSRSGSGFPGAGSPLSSGETRRIKIHGLAGVPDDEVESVVLNLTAVRQRGAGGGVNYLTIWPAGFEQPTVSNLNLRNGETVGNMVSVSTAAGGYVDVFSNLGTVDITVDVLGYFASAEAPGGARFGALQPRRVIDTRPSSLIVGPGRTLDVDILPHVGGDGSGVVAAVVNVTAVQPSERSFFRIFPTGSAIPDASAMNFDRATNTNRLVTVAVNDGKFTLRNEVGWTHVTVDLVGYYVTVSPFDVPGQGGRFVGVVPFRTVDTRTDSPFAGDGRIPGGSVLFQEGYRRNLTLAANLTAIRPNDIGYMSAGPWTGANFTELAAVSSLNYSPGSIVSNHTFVAASERNGAIAVYNSAGLTHFALDVFGYYVGT